MAGAIVRFKSNGVCEAREFHEHKFPCQGGIQCNHVFKRENYRTRWLFENLFPACASFNVWSKFNEGQMHVWFERRHPQRYAELQPLVGSYKPSITEMEELLEKLRAHAHRLGIVLN